MMSAALILNLDKLHSPKLPLPKLPGGTNTAILAPESNEFHHVKPKCAYGQEERGTQEDESCSRFRFAGVVVFDVQCY